MTVRVIGAGLAGCEAAWQAARLGVEVILYEMKPAKMPPAHSYRRFAELVCSNSLRSADITSGAGLLKEELSRMGSLIMEAAKATAVPELCIRDRSDCGVAGRLRLPAACRDSRLSDDHGI